VTRRRHEPSLPQERDFKVLPDARHGLPPGTTAPAIPPKWTAARSPEIRCDPSPWLHRRRQCRHEAGCIRIGARGFARERGGEHGYGIRCCIAHRCQLVCARRCRPNDTGAGGQPGSGRILSGSTAARPTLYALGLSRRGPPSATSRFDKTMLAVVPSLRLRRWPVLAVATTGTAAAGWPTGARRRRRATGQGIVMATASPGAPSLLRAQTGWTALAVARDERSQAALRDGGSGDVRPSRVDVVRRRKWRTRSRCSCVRERRSSPGPHSRSMMASRRGRHDGCACGRVGTWGC